MVILAEWSLKNGINFHFLRRVRAVVIVVISDSSPAIPDHNFWITCYFKIANGAFMEQNV